MDLEFDFKGAPIGGVITNCKILFITASFFPLATCNFEQVK